MVTGTDMARRRKADRRSIRAWWRAYDGTKLPKLIVAVVFGLGLAAVSAVHAASAVYDRHNPVLLELLFGSDEARIVLWTIKAVSDPKSISDERIIDYAQSALRRDPLNPGALRALALYYDGAKEPKKAERLAVLSDRVTRRDPLTQILLVQYAARGSDEDAALDHLDSALTTVDRGREQIFPIISAQLQNAELRKALPRLVKPRNTWMAEYLDYVMRYDQGGAKVAAEILLDAAPRNAAPVYAKMGDDLLSSLAEAGELELLKQTYARARGDRPDVTQLPTFDRATIDPAIGWLSWTGVGDGSAGADLRVNGDSVQAVVYASAGTSRALALRRVLFLPPGSYRHFEERTASFGPPDTVANFEMKCIGGTGALIWKGPAARIDQDASGGQGPVIPTGCPAQMLEMFVSSPLGAGGSEFVIEDFDLRRAG